jgi:hypothetical protein
MWPKGENGYRDSFLGRRWGWGGDGVENHVGLGKRWVRMKMCPWQEDGAGEMMWPEDEDGFRDDSLVKE